MISLLVMDEQRRSKTINNVLINHDTGNHMDHQKEPANKWIYIFVGGFLLIFIPSFICGFLQISALEYVNPTSEFIIGGLAGWLLWRQRSARFIHRSKD